MRLGTIPPQIPWTRTRDLVQNSGNHRHADPIARFVHPMDPANSPPQTTKGSAHARHPARRQRIHLRRLANLLAGVTTYNSSYTRSAATFFNNSGVREIDSTIGIPGSPIAITFKFGNSRKSRFSATDPASTRHGIFNSRQILATPIAVFPCRLCESNRPSPVMHKSTFLNRF